MSLVNVTTALQILGSLALGLRLIQTRLAGTYPFFTCFLLFEAVRMGFAAVLAAKPQAYAYFYFFTQPILWTSYALITLEVFQAAFRTQPGISTMSRRVVTVCVCLSVLISAATSALDVQQHSSPYKFLEEFLTLERVVIFSLLLFVVLLVIALTWFPILLTRNALVHASVFAFFFTAKTAVLLVRNAFGPDVNYKANLVLRAATVISLMLWGLLLTRAGEQKPVRSGYRRDPAEEQRLLAQLEAINRTLMGSARK